METHLGCVVQHGYQNRSLAFYLVVNPNKVVGVVNFDQLGYLIDNRYFDC